MYEVWEEYIEQAKKIQSRLGTRRVGNAYDAYMQCMIMFWCFETQVTHLQTTGVKLTYRNIQTSCKFCSRGSLLTCQQTIIYHLNEDDLLKFSDLNEHTESGALRTQGIPWAILHT